MRINFISKVLITAMILICLFGATIYADEDLVKRGDSSDDVALLQQLLKDKGYFSYELITGYYGKITEDAVKAFQRENGLKVDGITGAATWAALLSQSVISAVEEDKDNDTSITEEIEQGISYSIGMENADIALIQSRLIDLGFYNYNQITGYFGSITQRAVIAFQKSYGLQATGTVNDETWEMLFDNYTATSILPGTKSEEVIPLQTRLKELGYYAYEIDGIYGPKTQEAIVYFQKICSLTADGIADEITLEMLYSDNAIAEQEARRKITSDGDYDYSSNSNPNTEDVVALAKQYLGYPYVYGADGPDAFDCAGFTSYIYDLVGIKLPNSIIMQNYDNYGIKINNRYSLRVGDLVFFDTIFTDGNLADHVGIYIGDGNFIHVSKTYGERKVVIDSLTVENGWYTARFTLGRRIIKAD